MNFKRNKDENETAYIYRICKQKGINGLETWDDVGEVINKELNQNYSSARYRKQFCDFQKMVMPQILAYLILQRYFYP